MAKNGNVVLIWWKMINFACHFPDVAFPRRRPRQTMNKVRTLYKAARGILFTVIIMVVVLYLASYILLSVPSFQNFVKGEVEKEASAFIGSRLEIGSLTVSPFNEVMLHDVRVFDPDGRRCLSIESLGAGIRLWHLLREGKVELNYAEIIGLDANIRQAAPGSPLNIQFLINAFKPKDRNKPPAKFDLNFHNVVLRRCAVSLDKEWIPRSVDKDRTDFNHLRISDLKADINLPRIANDDFIVDLRRLSFTMSGGLDVETVAFRSHITAKSLSVENFVLKLPATEIRPSDIFLSYDGFNDIPRALKEGNHQFVIVDNTISLSDFSWLLPDFHRYQEPLLLSVEAEGNSEKVDLRRLSLAMEDSDLFLDVKGEGSGLSDKEKFAFSIDDIKLRAGTEAVSEILRHVPSLTEKVGRIIRNTGDIELTGSGYFKRAAAVAEADVNILTSCGEIAISGKASGLRKGHAAFSGEASADRLDLGRMLDDKRIGVATADVTLSGSLAGNDMEGRAEAYISEFLYDGIPYGGMVAVLEKTGKDISAEATIDNEMANATLEGKGYLDGAESWLNLLADVRYFHPYRLGFLKKYPDYTLSGKLSAQLAGDNIDNVTGEARLTDVEFFAPESKSLSLDRLLLTSSIDGDIRKITLRSDWVDGDLSGTFKVKDLPSAVRNMLSSAVPCILPPVSRKDEPAYLSDLQFNFNIKPDNTLAEFLNLPLRLLVDVPVAGGISGSEGTANLVIDAPYLQQGKNKLVRDTRLKFDLDGNEGTARLNAFTSFPAKKGDMALNLSLLAQHDDIFADVSWETIGTAFLNGMLSLGAKISKDELSGKPEARLDINPSVFEFGTTKWNIDKSDITYDDGILDVNDLRIWHGGQFIEIDGRASSSPLDSLTVRLADIDVGYVFDTLNINYVTFGGTATGDITAHEALGKEPKASTDNLSIKGLSYNGAVLGDGVISSRWNNAEKEVEIFADITGELGRKSTIDGGIWVTRDSLSFAIDADRVPVGFLGPFMSAFTSDVKGHASGKAKLFGTFSDIDLTGRILADSVAIKLDYTNCYYHGTDSVILNPGRIVIPSFRLYDREGHSAILSGELTHRYFHEPRFNFRISDVRGMLCYDTNSKINPDWYGTFYGNGNAIVRGWPGAVSVSVDMTAVGNSRFTFVLNDTQAAEDYRFLTFSDRRKEEAERLKADSISPVISALQKKMAKEEDHPSKFMIDIRGSVTPSTLMTLVMDPVAGDKITARGNGSLQIDYDSESDEMQMFGKYILDEGNYNFSLQDLILRDFSIRRGSSISFNGDPFNAQLDITAAYRVNTNLSDLDKSFSTDRDLARTNVPVDALLMVDGEMQHPDITFDIELPTLTRDVERKVKSIISTDDMMSRQIIYLLALNRFYTPEYMGATSNGGELASVASSTLSSQLSNMLGQLTDKFTLAPSFRSDKGDFSDIEVDVALSSRLLDNRLLINGNFGYRDRSTSQTTFVGDFDIEYLLSKSGNLRLKAYNHFNDQNYYLRQALTTQGIGVIYRKDFDNPFSFLRRWRERHKKHEEDSDSISGNDDKMENSGEKVGDSGKND